MVINEFLPNPVGKDTDGEWIELFNNNNGAINLFGWKIKDASEKTFTFGNYNIAGGEYLVLDYKTTKISLNNDGETLFLYNQNNQLIDKAEYFGKAAEGASVARKGNEFVFTSQPTPGKENVFTAAQKTNRTNNNIIADSDYGASINQDAIINNSSINNNIFSIGPENILIGLGVALFLAFASILIIKKLNLSNDYL